MCTTTHLRTDLLTNETILAQHLDALVHQDVQLADVLLKSAPVPLRLRPSGFEGMAHIVVGQLLSVASARAIWARVCALFETQITGAHFLALPREKILAAGLSRTKYTTLEQIALAEQTGAFVFAHIHTMPVDQAIAQLTALKGIGVWSAEVYLSFCVGQPDIFPAGDLALQKTVGYLYGYDTTPTQKQTRALSAKWAPYRGAAARLLWRYFAVLKEKEGLLL